jgi:outer membrane cobalamin receptor
MKRTPLSRYSFHAVLFDLLTIFFVCLFVASYSSAAEPQSLLDEIVVTASRFEEKLTNVPDHVTVINEERTRNSSAQNLPDILRAEMGPGDNKEFLMRRII